MFKKDAMFLKNLIPKTILLLLFVLVLIGPIIGSRIPKNLDENMYYPIWKNGLFSNFPNKVLNTRIKIYQLDNRKYPEGIDYYDLFPTIEGVTYSPSITIDNLGNYLLNKNYKKFEFEKNKFEEITLKNFKTAEYAITLIAWQPVPRFLKGEITKEDQLIYVQYKK